MSYGHRPTTIIATHPFPTPPPPPVPRSNVPFAREGTGSSSTSALPSPSTRPRAHTLSPDSPSPSPSPSPHRHPHRAPSSPLPTTIPPPKVPSPLPSPLPLDMKRLLSKPAPPYARTAHASGSESDGAYSTPPGSGKAYMKGTRTVKMSPRDGDQRDGERSRNVSLSTSLDIDIIDTGPLELRLDEFGINISTAKSHLGEVVTPKGDNIHNSVTITTTSSSSRSQELTTKRPRNVLRRRPSTTGMTNTSPVSLATPTLTTSLSPSSSAKSSPSTPRSPLITGSGRSSKPALRSPSARQSAPATASTSATSNPTNTNTNLNTSITMNKDMTTPSNPNPKHTSNTHAPDTHDTSLPHASSTPSSSSPTSSLLHLHSHMTTSTIDSPAIQMVTARSRDDTSSSNVVGAATRKSHLQGMADTDEDGRKEREKGRIQEREQGKGRSRGGDRRSGKSKSRSRSRNPGDNLTVTSSTTSSRRSTPLTPAGAVMEAYKRQEEARRSGSGSGSPSGSAHGSGRHAALASTNTSATVSTVSFGVPSGDDGGTDDDRDKAKDKGEEEGSAPYYTVVGSTTGRVVAVGGPEDVAWPWEASLSVMGTNGRGTGTRWGRSASTGPHMKPTQPQPQPQPGLARTLSRKVSARWLKGTAGGGGGSAEASGGEEELRKGRPSLQERRVGRFSEQQDRNDQKAARMRSRRSLRLSIDKFASGDVQQDRLVVESEGEGGGHGDVGGDVWAQRQARAKARRSDPSTGSGGGSKIWKLVKRISTGGLRDKYHHTSHSHDHYDMSPEEPPPPVPALPKEYHLAAGPRSADGHSAPPRKELFVLTSSPIATTPTTPTTTPPHTQATGGLARFIMPTRSRSTGNPMTVPSGPLTRRKSSVALGGNKEPSPTLHPSPQSPNPPPPPPAAAAAAAAATPVRTNTSNQSTPASAATSTPNARRSTTTRSSSPNSSDVASSRYFHRQSSARSSASSLFGDDDPPPMPVPKLALWGAGSSPGSGTGASAIGQHIIPPSELYRIHSEGDYSNSHNHSWETASNSDTVVKEKKPNPLVVTPSRQSDDWPLVHTPSLKQRPSLPTPPRRLTPPKFRSTTDPEPHQAQDDGDGNDNRPPSPIIPEFSIANPINTFGPSSRRPSSDARKPSPFGPMGELSPVATKSTATTPTTPTPPPPRPLRSSQRPRLTSGDKPTSTRPGTAPVQRTPSEHTGTTLGTSPSSTTTSPISLRSEHPGAGNKREPGSNGTSASPHTRRLSVGHSSSASTARPSSSGSPFTPRVMTFRELRPPGEARTHALTEQEKADRWEDLLERSDRAGGTLHLGGGGGEDGLRSDQMRFSVASADE